MLKEIIMSNFGIWLLLLSLLVIVISGLGFDKKVNILFLIFIGCISIMDAANIADYYLASLETLNNWRYVSSYFTYITSPLCLVVIMLILFRRERKNYITWLIWLPLVIETVILAISPFTHWVFYFNKDNNFQRGILGYLPHIISAIYFVMLVVMAFIYSSKIDKGEVITLLLIGVFALVATLLESLTDMKFLIPAAMSISCSTYYLYFRLRVSRVDFLTGLYNRQFFYYDLERVKRKKAVLISVDLNGLKSINDNGGHDKGDEALVCLSSCLLKAGSMKYMVYRTGGDEFIVVGEDMTFTEGEAYVAKVKTLLSATPYMASFGVAFYDGEKDINQAIKASDKAMYKDKSTYAHR